MLEVVGIQIFRYLACLAININEITAITLARHASME
jgi:hypothetical protein